MNFQKRPTRKIIELAGPTTSVIDIFLSLPFPRRDDIYRITAAQKRRSLFDATKWHEAEKIHRGVFQ